MSWVADTAWAPSLLVSLTAGLLIILDNWRSRLLFLAVQYVLVTWLSALALPPTVAAVKLVAGLMACGILALSARLGGWDQILLQARGLPSGHLFRLLAVMLVSIAGLGLSRENWASLPAISPEAIRGSTLLMALGLLQLGLSESTLRVGTGLMTMLSGFEIAYSVIEPSLAILALLAIVHIGFALIASFLLLGAGVETDEEPNLP